jgi:hypothetical protein
MFPSVTEILVLAVALGAVFLLPRLLNRGDGRGREHRGLAGRNVRSRPWMRLALVASVGWIVVGLLVKAPWTGNVLGFVRFALLPVAGGWALGWVVVGFRKRLPVDRTAEDDATPRR